MTMKQTLIPAAFFFAALVCAFVTLAILGGMVVLAYPMLLDGRVWAMLVSSWLPDQAVFGLLPMVLGTLWIALSALGISLPLSFGVSYFIVLLHPRGPGAWVKQGVEMMTAVPTVIYGFVGIFLLVPLVRQMFASGSGLCILSAALVLGILISPTLILFFVQSLSMVSQADVNTAYALGALPVQTFFYVLLPQAWKGMATGIILAFGRAMGDTLIALMLSGNSVAFPASILDPARTLTAHIALVIAADFDSMPFKSIFISGICLYIMTGAGVVLARRMAGKRG
jgi:phosphate transport system permease protein